MCASYQLLLPGADIAKVFKAKIRKPLKWEPTEKCFKGFEMPVILVDPETKERVVQVMTWGMPLYDWKKERMDKNALFNAKSETITEKKTFKGPFLKGRILIPATNFYEYQDVGQKYKKPWAIGLKTKKPFAIAGIWGSWNLNAEDDKTLKKKWEKNPDYQPPKKDFQLFSLITISPNSFMKPIHDRMPVILDPRNYDAWLDPEMTNTSALKSMLKQFPVAQMGGKALPMRGES